jgi:hypothetical protein
MLNDYKKIEYKCGDEVWTFIGDIVVKCIITEVDDQWRKKHPDGILFYWDSIC